MYQPKRYTETDRDTILSFMEAHPFATLIVTDGTKSYATQVPVMIEEREGLVYVTGHVFRHTDHYPILQNSKEALLMFTGVHTYISASWYKERGQASTWNYKTVQARGTVHMLDSDGTLALIDALTAHYEKGREHPELLENMPEEYIEENLKAIAGFEITLTSMEATFKLSQNKSDESYKNIVAQLMQSDNIEGITMAGELMQRRPHLFE